MKSLLTKLCWPILHFFEPDPGSSKTHINYRKSHRTALLIVGILFLALATGVGFAVRYAEDPGFWFPVAVFFALGFVSLVVGSLGSDAAVSRIWNSRQQ